MQRYCTGADHGHDHDDHQEDDGDDDHQEDHGDDGYKWYWDDALGLFITDDNTDYIILFHQIIAKRHGIIYKQSIQR